MHFTVPKVKTGCLRDIQSCDVNLCPSYFTLLFFLWFPRVKSLHPSWLCLHFLGEALLVHLLCAATYSSHPAPTLPLTPSSLCPQAASAPTQPLPSGCFLLHLASGPIQPLLPGCLSPHPASTPKAASYPIQPLPPSSLSPSPLCSLASDRYFLCLGRHYTLAHLLLLTTRATNTEHR